MAVYRVAGEATAEIALVPLTTMVEELRGLAGQIADLARHNEALALEVGMLRERAAGHAARAAATEATIATKDQALAADVLVGADLRRTAAQVEAAVARRREAALDATAALGGFWTRVRRVFGGGE